jgi:hypothetical protein
LLDFSDEWRPRCALWNRTKLIGTARSVVSWKPTWRLVSQPNRKTECGGKELAMTWEQITHQHWPRCERLARRRWRELSKGDLAQIDGSRQRLAERLRERYGLDEEEAERQLREFQSSCEWDEEPDW